MSYLKSAATWHLYYFLMKVDFKYELISLTIFNWVMFLTKKNAIYFNKPKTIDLKKPKRILPGKCILSQVGRISRKTEKINMISHQANTKSRQWLPICSRVSNSMILLLKYQRSKAIPSFTLIGTNLPKKEICKFCTI